MTFPKKPRKLKPETEIRNLKVEAKRHRDEAQYERTGRLRAELAAKRAEIEAKKWQARFDEILTKIPLVPISFSHRSNEVILAPEGTEGEDPTASQCPSLTEQAVMRAPECATHGNPMHDYRNFRIEYGFECSCPEGTIWAPKHIDPDRLERAIAEALR